MTTQLSGGLNRNMLDKPRSEKKGIKVKNKNEVEREVEDEW